MSKTQISKKIPSYDKEFKELALIARNDINQLGWQFREISKNDIIVEIELSKTINKQAVCIKAIPTKLDFNMNKLEADITESKSRKYLEVMQNAQSLGNKDIRGALDANDREINDDQEIGESSDFLIINSIFILGIQKSALNPDKGLILTCSSQNGIISIKNILTSSEKCPLPKYDGNIFINEFIKSDFYKGPSFIFIDNFLKILINQYLLKFEINEKLLAALEFLSASSDFKRLVQGTKLLESTKENRLVTF